MANANERLTTREAAAVLGVGTSSIKRWADQGLLRCERTPGGHRRISRSALMEFIRRGAAPAANEADFSEQWVQLLLREADPGLVHGALAAERRARGSWWETSTALGEVMERLGRMWADGHIDVLAEHLASARLERALGSAADAIEVFVEAPRCLLVTSPGDEHTLGLSLIEPCLREAGWLTQWAGRRTPLEPVRRRIEAGGIDAVAVSASAVATESTPLASFAIQLGEVCRTNGALLWLGGAGAWPRRPTYGERLTSLHELDAAARAALARRRPPVD